MPSRRLIKDPERYKTVLCATWASAGECPYGRKCQFAHGKEELRARTTPIVAPRAPGVMQPPMPMQQMGMRPGLPPAPATMWPAGPSLLHSSQLPMPPLPHGPPPGSSMMGGAPMGAPSLPPLPPGPPPPPAMAPSAATPFDAAAAMLHASSLGGGHHHSLGGPMPGALLSGAAGAVAPAPAPATLPAALLPHAALPPPPAMAPAAEMPQAGTYAAPSGYVAPLAHHRQLPSSGNRAPPPPPHTHSRQLAPAAAPAAAPTAAATTTLSALTTAEELACFAMKCHVAERGCVDDSLPEGPPRIWSEAAPLRDLRCHPMTGKVEAVDTVGLGIRVPSQLGSESGRLDSPLEGPGSLTSKGREVSFSTLLVRRAVSFIFDDPMLSPTLEPRLPSGLSCSSPRLATQSPHTAIAA